MTENMWSFDPQSHHTPGASLVGFKVEAGEGRGDLAGGRRADLLDCRFKAVDVPAGHEDPWGGRGPPP
ncbi:hypothetical protein ABT236_35365, partial [Streptomyces sp. NPDC001523]